MDDHTVRNFGFRGRIYRATFQINAHILQHFSHSGMVRSNLFSQAKMMQADRFFPGSYLRLRSYILSFNILFFRSYVCCCFLFRFVFSFRLRYISFAIFWCFRFFFNCFLRFRYFRFYFFYCFYFFYFFRCSYCMLFCFRFVMLNRNIFVFFCLFCF